MYRTYYYTAQVRLVRSGFPPRPLFTGHVVAPPGAAVVNAEMVRQKLHLAAASLAAMVLVALPVYLRA